MGRRIDWVKIKQEYIESNITLEELAKKHTVSFSTIRQKSAKEGWTTEKNIFRTKIEQKYQEKQSDLLASEASNFDNQCLRVARSAIEIVEKQIASLQKKTEEQKTDALIERQIRLLEKLANSLKQLQSVGKTALGEPTEIQAPLNVVVRRVYQNERND